MFAVLSRGVLGLARRQDVRAIALIAAELAEDEVLALAVEAALEFPQAHFIEALSLLVENNPDSDFADEALYACREVAEGTVA